ncbi:cilia- and flagella-associated protein 107-like [Mytilus trossulus]|uniref:cilia- and flagella-associated protein 107-like n=1 Tax=Mytilus trossulus TaxID=6551 RepID=UPI003005672A
MAQGDPMKWGMPGWRIEQKFAPGVLIGNWGEDRYTFLRGDQKHNSTHRTDFRNFAGHRPDVLVRRKALMKNDGIGPEALFHHHGNRYSNNMVSWYDENFNGRWKDNALPDLRDWNGHQLAWAPEKSDYPLQGKPTNYGLLDTMKQKWADQIADETKGDYLSTYQNSFIKPSGEAFTSVRYAIPKAQSTSLHPYNSVNKDLKLRGGTSFKSPERLPEITPVTA